YTLQGAYGAYDPNLSLAGQHNHRESGAIFANNQIILGSKTDADAFNSSINGKLPWGTTYTVSGNVADTHGTQAGIPFENTAGAVSITGTQPLLKNFWFDANMRTIKIAKNRLKYSD